MNEPYKAHMELINLENQYGNIKGPGTDNSEEQKAGTLDHKDGAREG